LLSAVRFRITGSIASRNSRPIGPAALLLLIRAAHRMMPSTRGPAGLFEVRERSLRVGQVAQALGEHHRVLHRQRCALPGRR
jgi:hypothetical protein